VLAPTSNAPMSERMKGNAGSYTLGEQHEVLLREEADEE
jgi:hypothetical protein